MRRLKLLFFILLTLFVSVSNITISSNQQTNAIEVSIVQNSNAAITLTASANTVYATTTVSTSAVNTTGASLIVVGLTYRQTQGPHISDSKGNTWTICTKYEGSGSQSGVVFYYCVNPTVGSGHTFSNTDGGGTANFGGISVFAFSGTATSSPKDRENGQFIDPLGATATPGSITPSANNYVVLTTCMNWNGTAPTIPTGYTGFNWTTATAFAGGCGYKIQTTASAENPSWGNMNSGSNGAVNVISFKVASTAVTTYGGFLFNMLD